MSISTIPHLADCPHCHSNNAVVRIKRHPFIRQYFFFLPLKRYRCSRCVETYYRIR